MCLTYAIDSVYDSKFDVNENKNQSKINSKFKIEHSDNENMYDSNF